MTIHKSDISLPRKVGRHHIAFLRGCVQNPAEIRTWWERYLYVEGGFRERKALSTCDWLKQEVANAALSKRQPHVARLVKLRISPPVNNVVPLEIFAQRFPEDFYSESELLELWQEAIGPEARKAAKRGKLVQDQLKAINHLESIVAKSPKLDDFVESWLEPGIAGRLAREGIETIQAVVDRINGKGLTWWTGIPGVGRIAGEKIQRWIVEQQASLGCVLTTQALQRRSALDRDGVNAALPKETGVVPLERFVVPVELNGSQGRFRAPPELCMLDATNDYEAIVAWLNSKRPKVVDLFNAKKESHTQRAYRKEAERFLLWSIIERKKPISSMTLEDCIAYRDFLHNPQPRENWCGQRGRARWGPLWRPFNGPLSPSAERTAIIILRTMYEWFMRQRYVVGNPWVGVMPRQVVQSKVQIGRSFTVKQWQYIKSFCTYLPKSPSTQRLQMILDFLYITGLRLSEAVSVRLRDFYQIEIEDDQFGWMLNVEGKGGKLRSVPVPDGVIEIIQRYLSTRGLSPDVASYFDKGTFLIGKLDDGFAVGGVRKACDQDAGITAGTLYDALTTFFKKVSKALATTDKKGADRLAKASTHWLRHTYGSHAVGAGVPLEIVQNNLGHASLSTTTIYVTSEEKRRHKEVQKFWLSQK